MESWSRAHGARFGQVPRLAWVMARAYAPALPPPLRVLWAGWSAPAYLLLVWWSWGARVLVARSDGRATFTLTASGVPNWRGRVAIVPLLAVYVAALSVMSGWLEGLVDVDSEWASFGVQSGAVLVLGLLVLVPVRPWLTLRQRPVKAALRRHLESSERPHWEAAALAAWPPGRAYGTTLLREVLQEPPGVGTVWLVARELWLVPMYEQLGCEVVEGTGGRGMTLKLGPRV